MSNADHIPSRRTARGFTLIELLVVIVVIGFLIAAIALLGGRIMRAQKVKLTEAIMKNTKVAIDQFAELDPLGGRYNQRERSGVWDTSSPRNPYGRFGPYPPYRLDGTYAVGDQIADSVRQVFREPVIVTSSGTLVDDLSNRLWRDLGDAAGVRSDWVSDSFGGDANDDIRALYTYLTVYSPALLAQVPQRFVAPLKDTSEYVNPAGTGTVPGANRSQLVNVKGIHDAWGVPLDYMLYIKVEWGAPLIDDAGVNGAWRITERIPVLRSLGLTRDEYDELAAAGELGTRLDDAIYSDLLPTPVARLLSTTDGTLHMSGPPPVSQTGGWLRAKAAGDEYGYIP